MNPANSATNNIKNLQNMFLNHLLKPREWAQATNIGMAGELGDQERFYFRSEHILAIVEQALNQIKKQDMVLKVEAPVKVFGDIHGQY